jgi:hypothetical protein
MPYNNIVPLDVVQINSFNPVAGTPTGSRMNVTSHVRGRLLEVGFVPNSLVASAVTLAVAIGSNGLSSTASAFAQVVTSTLGTFASQVLQEGRVASVEVPQNTFLEIGDAIQFTTSGGNTSAIGALVYAVVERV